MPDLESFVLSILLSILLRIISKATVYLAKCAFRRWIALKRTNDQWRPRGNENVVPEVLGSARKNEEPLSKPVSPEN